MGHDVSAEIAVAPEDFLAGRALVRFEVGVRQHVGLEIGALVEAASANWALVRRLFQVQNAMDGQRPRLAETFAAIGAFERLLLRVDVTVKHKRKKENVSLRVSTFYKRTSEQTGSLNKENFKNEKSIFTGGHGDDPDDGRPFRRCRKSRAVRRCEFARG
jgi:hypothetical protein